MKVLNAAVHKLIKTRLAKGCEMVPSAGLLGIDPQLENLVSQVTATYSQQTSQRIGVFRDDADHLFPPNLREALEGPGLFFEFSEWAAHQLCNSLKENVFASGGYLFFCHYEVPNGQFFMVAKLTDSEGATFSADMTRTVQSTHLNVKTLQQVGRVNLKAWQEDQGSYVTFVSAKDDHGGSDYFAAFLGCETRFTNADETRKLVSVIRDFCTGQGLDEDASYEVRNRAFSFASSVPKGQPISLDELANATWPEAPSVFTTFLNAHPKAPTDGFVITPSRLNDLVSYRLRMNGLTIHMSDEFKRTHRVQITGQNTLVIHDVSNDIVQEIKGGSAA